MEMDEKQYGSRVNRRHGSRSLNPEGIFRRQEPAVGSQNVLCAYRWDFDIHQEACVAESL